MPLWNVKTQWNLIEGLSMQTKKQNTVSDRLAAFSLHVKRLEGQFNQLKKDRMNIEQKIMSKSNRIDQIIAENEKASRKIVRSETQRARAA